MRRIAIRLASGSRRAPVPRAVSSCPFNVPPSAQGGATTTSICGGSSARSPTRRRARATRSSGRTSRDLRSGAERDGRSWRRRTRSCGIAFAMLRDGQPYQDPQVDYQTRTANRNKARWLTMLRKANLPQEVATEAAAQLGGAPDASPSRAAAHRGGTGARVGLKTEGTVRARREGCERRGEHAHWACRTPPSHRRNTTPGPTNRPFGPVGPDR